MKRILTLHLIKARERFIIRFPAGDELWAYQQLDAMVKSRRLNFDDHDRHALIRQMLDQANASPNSQ